MDREIQGKNLIILCHSDKANDVRTVGSGFTQPFLDYLLKNGMKWVFLLEQTHPVSLQGIENIMEVYHEGKLVESVPYKKFQALFHIPPEKRVSKTYIRLKLRDIFSARYFFKLIRKKYLKKNEGIDFLVGVESLNALLGLWYRSLLKINKVIYYLCDWAPVRYNNKLLNSFYVWLDKMACRKSDSIWNITWAIEEGRKDILNYDFPMPKQLTVPFSVDFKEELVRPLDQVDRKAVFFSGGLIDLNGVLMLPEIAKILKRKKPDIRIYATGRGDKQSWLEEKIKEYNLDNLIYKGFIKDVAEYDRLICSCAIGLSPYPDAVDSTKKYGDVAKVRTYFSAGLVVVTTGIPPIAREIIDEKLGIVTEIDNEKLADAVIELVENDSLYKEYRQNVINKARNHTWDRILSGAFRQTME